MMLDINSETLLNDALDCMGEFNREDNICRHRCALRLRCAIEHNQKTRLELIEDFMASSDTFITFQ